MSDLIIPTHEKKELTLDQKFFEIVKALMIMEQKLDYLKAVSDELDKRVKKLEKKSRRKPKEIEDDGSI